MPQAPRSQFSFERPVRVVVWLIGINAILWFAFAVLINSLHSREAVSVYSELMLTPEDALLHGHVWQLLSYSWLHDLDQLTHVLFNCVALYFLGNQLARRWGTKTFLKFYLLSGLIAGIVTMLVGALVGWRFGNPVVGASGAIFGLVAANALLFPNAQFLLFFVLPVRARYLIWLSLGIDFVLFLAAPNYAIAVHTHAGGALGGWLLITGNWHPKIFLPRLKALFAGRRTGKPFRVYEGGRTKPSKPGSGRDDLN